jgi:hypothetical protein
MAARKNTRKKHVVHKCKHKAAAQKTLPETHPHVVLKVVENNAAKIALTMPQLNRHLQNRVVTTTTVNHTTTTTQTTNNIRFKLKRTNEKPTLSKGGRFFYVKTLPHIITFATLLWQKMQAMKWDFSTTLRCCDGT